MSSVYSANMLTLYRTIVLVLLTIKQLVVATDQCSEYHFTPPSTLETLVSRGGSRSWQGEGHKQAKL